MLVTFKPVVISTNRNKDGGYPLKIRVTFKGVSRRLPTNIKCYQSDLTRSLAIKNSDVLRKAQELINRMQESINGLSPFDMELMSVDDIVAKIRKELQAESFHLDFFVWCDTYVRTYKKAAPYIVAANALKRFNGSSHLDINDITRPMVIKFVEYYENEPKNCSTKNRYMKNAGCSNRVIVCLGTMFKAAKKKYNDEDEGRILIPRNPFSDIERPAYMPKGQRNLGVDIIQKMIDDDTCSEAVRYSLDIFLLSFCLQGANIADMAEALPFTGDVWEYERKKTRNRRRDKAHNKVKILAPAAYYIERRKGVRKWLCIYERGSEQGTTCTVNSGLKRWAEANGIPPFTFYAARHSWASIGRSLGIEKATIDECLCHVGDYDLADIYAERAWNVMWQANEKVLSQFRWKIDI